jgi:RNA polymerase sigma factor (sigma-70 family)
MTGENEEKPGRRMRFATTRWSIVVAASAGASDESRTALAVLCETYWYPLYAFARRRGSSVEQAEDLTQGFFARFLEKNDVQDADCERGRFRTFLLTSFKHFIANEWDRSRAAKRGGKVELVHLDFSTAEGRFATECSPPSTPDQEFERQWAHAVLAETVERLRAEYRAAGKERLFAKIEGFLPGSVDPPTCRACAESLGTTEGAVKMAVHRLRGRYRSVLREVIADTLGPDASVDEEIRYLMSVLGA